MKLRLPHTHHFSELELKVLQSCLKRWRLEIESNVKNLQDSINNIENTIKDIYDDSSLKKEPYRLHAVLVHEGQAASGHYWAYVFSPSRNMWLKFNDVSVTEATWAEVLKDSVGGHHYASAYCLLYVDELNSSLFDASSEAEMGPGCLSSLPLDLQNYVREDNDLFLVEMEQWDIEQSRKKDTSTMALPDNDCTIIAERCWTINPPKDEIPGSNPPPFVSQFSAEHAVLNKQKTLTLVHQYKVALAGSAALDELERSEIMRIRRIARSSFRRCDVDNRLSHIGVYIIQNSTYADPHLTLSVLEQFMIPELDETPSAQLIKDAAIKKFKEMYNNLSEDQRNQYRMWHVYYSQFRHAVTCFVTGIESYTNCNYTMALSAFNRCLEENKEILKRPGHRLGLDEDLIEEYRRQSALKLNEQLANQFETRDSKEALDALCTACEYIIPCMDFLASPQATEEDIQAAETIRNQWCSLLAYDIASPKVERLNDFLSKLIDPSNEMPESRPNIPLPIFRINDLETKYSLAMKTCFPSSENMALSS